MNISIEGLDLIKEFEGFRSEPYLCPAGIPTIGYGNTRYNDGTKVQMDDEPISKSDATYMLKKQVDEVYSAAVNKYARECNQNQFDALTSFTYNLGAGNLRKSTLLKKHNEGDFEAAAKEFPKWVRSNGVILNGLVRRRKAEAALYSKTL